MNIFHSKKFRYGSVSLALTIIIIAAVILINAIFTALSRKFLWYIDMTPQAIYTLSDEAKALLDEHYVPTEREVTVIFCSEKDVLEANTSQRYVLYTVLEMADTYKNIHVKYVDVFTNPSEVNRFKETSGQDITTRSIIVTSGTESRVYTLDAMFTYNENNTQVLGYNGEQRLVSAILAVTRAESPIVCVTNNHGELDSLMNNNYLLTVLYETGYRVEQIDLTRQDIPADCRLLLVFDPQSDFRVKTTLSDVSELEKIDAYLDRNNAMMVFMDYDSPVLPNFEEFLEEWGIKVARSGEVPYLIQDTDTALNTSGYAVKGQYTEAGLGASITAQLRRAEHPRSVIFPMTTAFVTPESYEQLYDETSGAWTGYYFRNGVLRDTYDVFLSSPSARAFAGDQVVANAADMGGMQAFSYMKVTCETKTDDQGNDAYAYLLACASTEFASSAALDSGYGNRTVVTYACSVLGRAVISVALDCKYFTDNEINDITAKAANQYTVVLTAVPAGAIFIAGIYVMIRRKYA